MFSPQEVRNGRHVLRFNGRVLGEGSSRRVRSPRWSEATIYAVDGGGYVLARRGCSLVVHRPGCPVGSRDVMAWIDLPDDRDRHAPWSACVTCSPDLVDFDPQTMVEGTRYTAAPAGSPRRLVAMLWDRPPHLPPLPQIPRFLVDAVEQACVHDTNLTEFWVHRARV